MLEVRPLGTNKQRGQELLLEQMRVLKEKSDAGKVTGHDLYDERWWIGIRLFADTEVAIEIEDRAYDIEIDFAREYGYNDVVERLEKLKDRRRRELRGEFDLK